jgi:hypothetical protein
MGPPTMIEEVRFAIDSLMEGDGFELLVPGRETVKPSWDDCLENGSGSVGEPKFESVFLQL